MIDPRWISGLRCTNQVRPAGRQPSGETPDLKDDVATPGPGDEHLALHKTDPLGARPAP